MSRHTGLPAILFALLLGIATLPAFAQFSSSIQGSVQDASGAAVPNATLSLVNAETQVSSKATSDATGIYHFPSLAPGHYLISAAAQGFSSATISVTLSAGENRNVPFSLVPGSVSTRVEVTSQAPLLDTSDSRNQMTLNTREMQALPLPTLNPTDLMELTPGVTGHGDLMAGGGAVTNFFYGAPDESANGSNANGNLYVLDGLNINLDVNLGFLSVVPNADSLSELTVQTNTYTVDYGQASSLQTVMTTKSGTSQYHGFGSSYYSYQGFDARGEFGPPQPAPLAPFHTNLLSFGLGGPVIPHHKIFFYFGIEPYLSLLSNGNSVQTYEDPAFVTFAQAAQPSSPELKLLQIYKPTGATTTGVAATAQDLFGAHDTATNTGCATPSTDNIPCSTPVFDHGFFNSSSYNNSLQYSLRLDKYFTNDRLYGTLFRDTVSTGGPAIRPAFATTNAMSNLLLQANETHTFSPNTLNEAAFGYILLKATEPSTGLFSVPVVSVSGLGVGFGDGFADGQFLEHNYHWRDVLTHIQGAHSFKLGYEGWHGDDVANFAAAYGQPSFTFNSMIDLINNQPYDESGLSYNPVTGTPQAGNYAFQMNTIGAFAEDTWKASHGVTLNYGIRYDNYGNPYPENGTVLANFIPGAGSTTSATVADGAMKVVGHVYAHDMNWLFSPRVGVAWDPTGTGAWVVRGGVGIYRNWVTLGNAENDLKANPPSWVVPTFYNNGSTAPPVFSYGTNNSYPFGFVYPSFHGEALDAKGGIVGSQVSVGGVDRNLGSPLTTTWSATLERQITSTLVGSVGYVGTHSTNLIVSSGSTVVSSFGVDVNVFPGDLLEHPNCNSTNTLCTGQQTRLNTSFGSIAYTTNGAWSNYNALILALRGRFAQRGFVTASYTRSVSKDNAEVYPTENPLSRWYAPSPWDTPNRLSVGWSYALPGISGGKGFLGRVLSGWGLAGTTILQSGLPFAPYTTAPFSAHIGPAGALQFNAGSGDFNADGDNYDYPNVASYRISRSRNSYKEGVFPHCSGTNLAGCGPFTLPQPGEEGDERLNQFRNPGFAQTDLTLEKTTMLTEGVSLELRFNAFNLFNRVNLNGVDANANDGTNFGISTNTQIPREGQVAARISF